MTTARLDPPSPKLRPWHLDRAAVVYVRQSTPQQVLDHQESTARQYALADRATALGWPRSQVQVIDDDLGKSGQSVEGRPGFQRPGLIDEGRNSPPATRHFSHLACLAPPRSGTPRTRPTDR